MNAAARLLAAAVALSTMSCAFLETDFQPDAGPVPPPWIVPHEESPPFESTLQYGSSDIANFKVTVADVDLALPIQVRFCLRETADSPTYLLAVNPVLAAPKPQPEPKRTPVVVDIQPCNRFGGGPSDDTTHFLYTIVAAKDDFVSPENGCDVNGSDFAYAFWRFTCNKPQ